MKSETTRTTAHFCKAYIQYSTVDTVRTALCHLPLFSFCTALSHIMLVFSTRTVLSHLSVFFTRTALSHKLYLCSPSGGYTFLALIHVLHQYVLPTPTNFPRFSTITSLSHLSQPSLHASISFQQFITTSPQHFSYLAVLSCRGI